MIIKYQGYVKSKWYNDNLKWNGELLGVQDEFGFRIIWHLRKLCRHSVFTWSPNPSLKFNPPKNLRFFLYFPGAGYQHTQSTSEYSIVPRVPLSITTLLGEIVTYPRVYPGAKDLRVPGTRLVTSHWLPRGNILLISSIISTRDTKLSDPNIAFLKADLFLRHKILFGQPW